MDIIRADIDANINEAILKCACSSDLYPNDCILFSYLLT